MRLYEYLTGPQVRIIYVWEETIFLEFSERELYFLKENFISREKKTIF